MRGLRALTIATIRSFVRDRAAIFWTLAFPIIFIVLFGSIFSGRTTTYEVAWVDLDRSPPSAQLRQAFAAVPLLRLEDRSEQEGLDAMRQGRLRAVIVAPAGLGAAIASGGAGGARVSLRVYVDPSQQTSSQTVEQIVRQVVGGINQGLSGRPPVVALEAVPLQTQRISAAAYFVPSILAMALMQLGVFSAVPLVAQREKLILKRLAATPLRRSTLVASNVIMRLLIALVQAVVIMAIGIVLFDVVVVGDPLVLASLVVLGALTFISIGYVIASFTATEESATALTSIVQFPLMFLSGIFFPIDFMPDFLRPVAGALPLTYLGDALRQVMVGGAAFVPVPVDVLVLGGWLIATFAISARFFRWQ